MSPITVSGPYSMGPAENVCPPSLIFSDSSCCLHGLLTCSCPGFTADICNIQTVISDRIPRFYCNKRGINSDVLVPLNSYGFCASQRYESQQVFSPSVLNSQADFVMQNGLGFIHMNVRSLVSKMDYIMIWALQTKADIFVFSETWLADQVSGIDIAIEGYNVFRSDRSKPTKGGGCSYFC